MRKESVGAYYVRYLRLLSEMAANKPVDSATQIAKFVDGLQPGLRAEISRIHRRAPTMTLDDISSEAEKEERANPPKTTPVQVNGIETNNHKPVKRSFFCRGDKGKTHTAENCPEIAKRKANGTWQDRPRKQAGRRS